MKPFNKYIKIITLIFMSVMITFVGCQVEEPINTQLLPKSVRSIISAERLKDLENLGITINKGKTPPDIEGAYLVSPFIKINANFEDSYNEVLDYTYSFSEQDNKTLTVLVEELNNDEGTVGTGNGTVEAAISGNGNDFSVFVKIHTDYPDGAKSDMISVISGELTDKGINNFQYATIMDNNYGNAKKYLMDEGQGRLWEDCDGIALRKGNLVFLTHGLSSDENEFKETVKLLSTNDNYFDFGYVTMRDNGNNPVLHFATNYSPSINTAKDVDELVNQGKNVLVRTAFSAGNLSFAKQLEEMGKMTGMFAKHNANVVFIGHSMGGLASINYAVDYARDNPSKKVKINTVDTPYHPNVWAKRAWDNEHGGSIARDILGALFNSIFYKQPVAEAQRDLGGRSTALEDLKNKWNTNSGNKRLSLCAIAVSMYAKYDKNDKKNTELNWSDKGDGVVDIPSQQGKGWNNVNLQDIIFGYGQGHTLQTNDLTDTIHLYHHVNTPDRSEVIDQIRKLIK